jgi:predicted permease
MFQDLRFGLKLLWKEKAFSFAALITLALCIGANTAIFTVLKAVILEPLPLPEAERLVSLYNIYPGVGVTDFGANGIPDYVDRAKMTDVFDSVTLMGQQGYDVGAQGTAARVDGASVTPSYFKVVRTNPVVGRPFNDEDAVVGKEKSVILSYGLWKDMFNRDPGIVGRDLRLSGVPYRVVGVMPENYEAIGAEVRLFVPLAWKPEDASDDRRHNNNWGMMARLKPGVTIAQAQERINALNKFNVDRFPKYKKILEEAKFGTRVAGLKEELVKQTRPLLLLLQAAVGFVLLIGCVNVANLMLVRANVRMKELAIRFSLGADRWRIGRQLLTECVTLAVLGGLLGIAFGYGGVRLLMSLGAKQLPPGIVVRMDSSVMLFSAAVAILTGVAFGLVPVFHILRRDLNDAFRQTGRTGTSDRGALWTRSALVVCQVAIAFVLLAGSGLLMLSFQRLLGVKPGFQPDNVVTARYSLPGVRYKDDAAVRAFTTNLLDSLRALPGVNKVGATSFLPFGGGMNASVITIEGYIRGPGEPVPVPAYNTIDAGYLQAMGIPLLQGREFTASDGADTQKVVLIDEFLARKYWPKSTPLGGRIQRGVGDDKVWWTIVGVVGSVKTGDLANQNPIGQVYFPYTQFSRREMHIVVRSAAGDAQVTPAIRRQVMQADPELAVFDVKTMPQRVSQSVAGRRAAMVICLAFAGLALLLSAVGIYGVLAYGVTQRTREFGIRVALGARGGQIVSMVLSYGLKLAVAGLVIGVFGAVALTRLMTSLLFSIKPTDPALYVSVGAALLGVALVAALIPSIRAVRVRPAAALRCE